MESKICLDTTFLVDFLRNNKEAVEFFIENVRTAELATTYINVFELHYGAYKSKNKEINARSVEALTKRLVLLNLTEDSAKEAGEVLAELKSKGEVIETRDLLIGTIASTRGYALKTENIKHFQRIRNLQLC